MKTVIAAQRLARQRLSCAQPGRAEDVVASLGAVQAQEYGPAKWALGLRMRRAVDADVEQAMNDGRVLRTHVMRPTWHFVAAADLRWLLDLTAPRIHRILSYYNRQLGLDAAVLSRGLSAIERALGDRQYLTRAELGQRLRAARLTLDGVHLARIVMHAELEGVICSGPRRGKQFTYALAAERAPSAARLTRDEALATLALRYFSSHGPATARDFAWWSGLTVADAKRGLEMNAARRIEWGGEAYWTIGSPPRGATAEPAAHLLPIYDEYLVAYRDRVAVPHAPAAPTGRVTFQHAIVVGGQVGGTWRPAANASGVRIELTPFRPLSRRERGLVEDAAERYAAFVGARVTCAFGQARR